MKPYLEDLVENLPFKDNYPFDFNTRYDLMREYANAVAGDVDKDDWLDDDSELFDLLEISTGCRQLISELVKIHGKIDVRFKQDYLSHWWY